MKPTGPCGHCGQTIILTLGGCGGREKCAWCGREQNPGWYRASDGSIIGEKSMSDREFLAPLLGEA